MRCFFIDGFRHRYFDMMDMMFIVIYPTHQPVVLVEISYDKSQDESFDYIFRRFISSEVKSFVGEVNSYYGKINDRGLSCCLDVIVAMSTWSLRHSRVAQ